MNTIELKVGKYSVPDIVIVNNNVFVPEKNVVNIEKCDRCESILEDLEYLEGETRSTIKDYKEQNLSLNCIELAGFLRAFLTIKYKIS